MSTNKDQFNQIIENIYEISDNYPNWKYTEMMYNKLMGVLTEEELEEESQEIIIETIKFLGKLQVLENDRNDFDIDEEA